MAVIKPFRGSLAVTFAAAFAPKVRDRGERYYSNCAVEIEYAIGNLLEATVTGGEMYDVSMQIDGEMLRVECTCKFVEQGELCKHIYATLLAADSKRFGVRFPVMSPPVWSRLHLRSSHETGVTKSNSLTVFIGSARWTAEQ